MNIILFDDITWNNLLPLTFTRPVSEIRIGILTIKEKWEKWAKASVSYETQDHLRNKFKKNVSSKSDNIFINSKIVPDKNFVAAVKKLKAGSALKQNNIMLACNVGKKDSYTSALTNATEYKEQLLCINNVWDIFSKNGEALNSDFKLLTAGRKSARLSSTNKVVGNKKQIFIEKGAVVEASILSTKNGPIYIGKDAEVMEGSVVRGPFALGEHSALKLSTKIYGPTTIGPHSKVGGEVNNSVIFGYSNKAHDGFLGNSVIGEWCNLGADTNNSNLKNNYGNVKLYNYKSRKNEDSGLQFCGLIMADHSKSGINTMFNTGTVVGVGANIFGGGFPPTHIPSFSWGGAEGFETYKLDKMFETTQRVFDRRGLKLESEDKDILSHIFNETKEQR
jgi:UDP-N-acetylglucosamine diphosphorylase/glucosamine-1-phosphate N-acetyltransferase